jgi:hypothetical protein
MDRVLELVVASSIGAMAGAMLKDWIANWLKARSDRLAREEQRISESRWEIKRQACLDSLIMADAALSHMDWTHGDMKINPVRQPVSTVKAREVMNRLAVSCENSDVLQEFSRALGLREPGNVGTPIPGDTINRLRDAVRRELGYGQSLKQNASLAFIIRLQGDGDA